MVSSTRLGLITRRVLAAALLAAGIYLLVGVWGTFSQFGLTRGLGYPRVSHAEITFWYALSGVQASPHLYLPPSSGDDAWPDAWPIDSTAEPAWRAEPGGSDEGELGG